MLDFNSPLLYYINMKNEYIETKLRSPIKISGVYTIHYFKYGRNFRFNLEEHDFWELVFLDSGNAKIISGENVLPLKQGKAFLHSPNSPHTIYTDEIFANSVIISFSSNSKSLKKIAEKVLEFNEYEKALLSTIISEAKLNYSDKLNDLFLKKMTKKEFAPFGSEQIIKNSIELLLVSLVRNVGSIVSPQIDITLNANSGQMVEKIRAILTEKLSQTEDINLDEISYLVGFSKSYIKTQFKKKTGCSIIQYFIKMKIEKAKKLLSEQKYTVSEIADNLGFSSVHYFSRLFKINTDMSPTEYINSIKANNVL